MTETESVERVLKDPLKFKNKLGIGEKAIKPLRRKKLAEEVVRIMDAVGTGGTVAGLASTPMVAALFTEIGLLATLGLATTPIGWVIAAGVASAAGVYGISLILRGGKEEHVIVIPKRLDEPEDVLAAVLFNFFAPLGFKVAALDGSIQESERCYIRNYFVDEWGYSKRFVQSELPKLECNVEAFSTVAVVNSLIEFKKNNENCNYEPMAEELTGFLQGVTKANGELHDQEVIFIQWLEIVLVRGEPGLWEKLSGTVSVLNPFSDDTPNGDGSRSDGGDGDGDGRSTTRAQGSKRPDRIVRTLLRWERNKP